MHSAIVIIGLVALALLIVALAVILVIVRQHRPNEDLRDLVVRSRIAWSEQQRNAVKELQRKE